MKKKNKPLIIIGLSLLSIVLIIGGYFLYLILAYYRLPDNYPLEIRKSDSAPEGLNNSVSLNREYLVVSYNIGFGAYSPDYTFFMDGGTQSWARSVSEATNNVFNSCDLVKSFNPDFAMIQEIDFDSTRTYHLNELAMVNSKFSEYESDFGINYDSPFLFYPLTQPHGASRAGLGTYSKYTITEATRRSLPVSTSFTKYLDLDRCYTVSRVPTDNGKELILINIHMSAYGGSDAVRNAQTSMLREEIEREYANGNYVIVGGDFNHDLKKPIGDDDNSLGWAHSYDRNLLPAHFSFAMDLLGEEAKNGLTDSCRDAGAPYSETTPTITVDGFIISDNVNLVSYENYDCDFAYSDHQPVVMKFILMD